MKHTILLPPYSSTHKNRALQICACLLFLCLLALIYYLYLPGLGGTFIFDDVPNFKPWADMGDITNTRDFIRFCLSSAHIPGRPLSLASFLINDQSWPADVNALKGTNLLLHLLNTCLCFWLLLKLLAPSTERKGVLMALFITALWTLHPLQVSNVSYIIQRMNLLSSLTTFAGLLLYVSGRAQLRTAPLRAFLYCSGGIGFFLIIGILCKENGLLLCAYALLIEYFFFSAKEKSPVTEWWPYWKVCFLWGPLLLFVAYTLYAYKGFTIGFENRNYNATERLLTQGPVLISYLNKLLIPHMGGTGLYFDNFPISISLWNPISTLYSWLFITGALLLSFVIRHKAPLFAFGVFFYFAGHSMESTLLPLELYFEHRNYLPQLGIWICVVSLFFSLFTHASTRIFKISAIAGALIFLVFISFLTRQNARLWGDYPTQAATWYNDNPTSLRAAQEYASVLYQVPGLEPQAALILQRSAKDHPNTLAPITSERYARCLQKGIPPDFDDLMAKAAHADYETSVVSGLTRFAGFISGEAKNPCPGFSTKSLEKLMLVLAENPKFAGSTESDLYMSLGQLAVTQQDLSKTITYYDAAFAATPNPIFPYRQAVYLNSAGLYRDAAHYLEIAEQHLDWHQKLFYPTLASDIKKLRASLPQ